MKYFELTDSQEQEMLNNCIDHTVKVDGFVFSFIRNKKDIYMFVYNTNEKINGYRTISNKSIEEHINFINENNVQKLFVCAEDIEFLSKCKSVKCVMFAQANENGYISDYSPLYEMNALEAVNIGGYISNVHLTKKIIKSHISNIDFSKIEKLKQIRISSTNNIVNSDIHLLKNLEILTIMDFDKKHLKDYFNSKKLKSLKISNSKLETLDGIEKSKVLEWLSLIELKHLKDISSLKKINTSLKALSIWNCPKIESYSVLCELENLEHLELYGNKSIPNLDFVKNMKKLKTLLFSINVEDGDLSNCLNIPCVFSLKDRKHYNFKNKELPKSKEYTIWYNFQNHEEDLF